MLRFIDLKNQITPYEKEFAWFDTVTDTFLELNGSQFWSSWNEFLEDLSEDIDWLQDLERFKRLAPPELQVGPEC